MKVNTDILKEFLKKQGITQSQLAEQYGCKQSFISEILSGKKPIPENILLSFSDNYNLSIRWLMTGEGEMFNPRQSEGYYTINNKEIHDNGTVIDGGNAANSPISASSDNCAQQIAALQQRIADKDALIASLQKQVANLEELIAMLRK